MALTTYDVQLSPNALRTIRVRARSADEAAEKAVERAGGRAGPWTIDYPGSIDEHATVTDAKTGDIVLLSTPADEWDDDDDG